MQKQILALAVLITSAIFSASNAVAEPLPIVGDATNGKQIAQQQCAQCHGLDGVSARSGSPFIAGLEQEYLIRSILAYQNKSRAPTAMKAVLENLPPTALADVTAYYAQLTTPWKGAVADSQSRAIIHDEKAIRAAKHMVTGCLSCHSQTARFQKDEAIPNLNGMPLEYFAPALNSYLNGKRKNQFMKQFKGRLSDKEIYSIGAYYAAQQPEIAPEPQRGDSAKGKIASRACAGCHGENGNSLTPHVPNLAGNSAHYIAKALFDYRDGKRGDILMRTPTQYLSDDTIINLAAYYAKQKPESQLHKDIHSKDAFNPLEEGRQLAKACNSCHDQQGNSIRNGIPSLTGQHVKYLVRATQHYQLGQRQHAAMQEIVNFYSDTDIEKMAYYYATRTPKPSAKNTKGNVENGVQLSSACTSCHGENGVSHDPAATPSLAGQDAAYIINATRAYAQGKRHHEAMKDVAQKLDQQQLTDLAAFFSSQTNVQVATYLPTQPELIIEQRCQRCHGDKGLSTQKGIPRLAGQLEPYIIQALQEYQSGQRKNHAMTAMADVLSLLEIKAIAAYYAKQ